MKRLICMFLTGGALVGGLNNPTQAQGVLDPGKATVTAQADGDWSDPATWSGGLPGPSDRVWIPAGFDVVFATTAEVTHILVDGRLRFDPGADSQMTLDTLAVGPDGELEIGRTGAPIGPAGRVDIVFRSDTDLDPAADPALLRRGLVADGPVNIHGQAKTVHLKVAQDPQAGDTSLVLARAPENWRTGDTIVLTGTRYLGWRWDNDILAVRYYGTQDEVREITAINGATVGLDQPLEYDHFTPRADLKASVANFSRNITFSSAGGEATPVYRRGHVMLRHATHFDVRYAAFNHLGRTDKSVPSFDLDQLETVEADSNVRGRYSLHFHMSGIDDPRNPAMAVGNSVFGSPGWGFVHHASNAVFHNNASFDTHGAGFVGETGDEIGTWVGNIAIRAEGNSARNPKNGVDVENYDVGRTGAGFWFQGRMIRSTGNIAASVNQGYVYLHRGPGLRGFPNAAFMLPEALRRDTNVNPDDAPIFNFHNNEAFASTDGLWVVKANPNQQHDIHSHFTNFTAWEVAGGSAMEYTSHYLLEDFDIIGKTPAAFDPDIWGIEFGTNTTDMVINRARIANMPEGIRLGKNFTDPHPPEVNQYVIIDPEFIDVDEHYFDAPPLFYYDPDLDQILTAGDLVPGRMEITLNNGELLEYNNPATSAGIGLDFVGGKLDSVGSSPIPAGTDNIGVPHYEMIAICEQDGYYRDSEGTPWVIVEEYFTDRATGTIHKFGLPVRLGPDVDFYLGNPHHAWRDAFQRGVIDFSSQPPAAADDHALTGSETETVIDLLANDADPDGDELIIDGIVQPRHGMVFDNGDGTVIYRPDFDFTGEDRFQYWASDDQGNFSPARVTVIVSDDILFRDRFE